ncbi:hypothetical protein IT412_00060, partial [Candidatus Peregrinibacteria bacterium]|nr:hypothetical protein [Candidatus Peregrinibacteria bacterium]
ALSNGGGIYTEENFAPGENKPVSLSYVQMDGNISGNDGGAIYAGNRTDLELDNVTSLTTANQATGAGGFLSLGSSGSDSSLVANNITISSNSANSCGAMTIGGAYTPATPVLTITDSTFSNNSSTTFGGAVCLNAGALLIDNTQFINNSAGTNGGGLFLNDNGSDSQTVLRNFSFFSSNSATNGNGGDVFVSQNLNNNELIVQEGVFNTTSNIHMAQGGSIFNQQGTVDISNSVFTGSRLMSVDYGGAIYNDAGSLTIDNSRFFTYLTNLDGAAINSQVGNVTINNSDFASAEASGNGGAIRSTDNTLNISGSSFDLCLAGNGAAIYDVDSIINIDNSSFTNGDAASGGGAIYTVGGSTDLNITKSYFGENEGSYGGAFYINEGDLSLINSTVENNDAVGGDGGGLYLSLAAGVIDIFSSTIANNHALAFGGGIRKSVFGPINMSNTIVANNTNNIGAFAGVDCASSGQLSSFGHNLISNSTGCGGVFDPTDILDVSAELGTLDFHGGTTLNYDLLPSSPAIDSGDSAEIDDQRGTARPQYAADDIGAHEFIDTTAPVISEVTPVPTPDTDTTPNYTFTSSEAGTITYGGGCSSSTTNAVVGPLTITFNTLTPGTYSLCTITVTDLFLNASNILAVSTFTITAPTPVTPPVSGSSGGGSSGGGSASFGQPATPNNPPASNNNNTPTTPPVIPSNNTPSNTPVTPSTPNTPANPPSSNPAPSGNNNSNSVPTNTVPTTPNPVNNSSQPVNTNTPDDTHGTADSNQIQITPVAGEISVGAPNNFRQFSLSRNSGLCNAAVFDGRFHLEPGMSMDSDGDGLSDAIECQISTDPTNTDTDNDGKTDSEEALNLFTNPIQSDQFNPIKIGNEFVIINLPEESLITSDDSPLFIGLANPSRDVDVYVFDSSDFDDYRRQLEATIQSNTSLTPAQKVKAYNDQFNLTVATILSKFIDKTLNPLNPFEAKFIDKVRPVGTSQTDQKGVFALDSTTSLVDNRYLVMGKTKNAYSNSVEFTLDSSLTFITPVANSLDYKSLTPEILSGQIVLTVTPGNGKPTLSGKATVPSRIVAIWQSNITSSALLADSLDQEFRLTPPTNLEPGDHTVMLTAYRNSDNAQSKTLKIKFNIPAKSTEIDFIWWPYALAAILLLLILILIMRRRQPSPQAATSTNNQNPTPGATSVIAPASPSSKLIDTQATTSKELPHPFASIPPLDQGSTKTEQPAVPSEKTDLEDKNDLLSTK